MSLQQKKSAAAAASKKPSAAAAAAAAIIARAAPTRRGFDGEDDDDAGLDAAVMSSGAAGASGKKSGKKVARSALRDAAAMTDLLADPKYHGTVVPTSRLKTLQGRYGSDDEEEGSDDDGAAVTRGGGAAARRVSWGAVESKAAATTSRGGDSDDAYGNHDLESGGGGRQAGVDYSEFDDRRGGGRRDLPPPSGAVDSAAAGGSGGDLSSAMLRPGRLVAHGSTAGHTAGLADDLDAELAALEADDAAAMVAYSAFTAADAERGHAVEGQLALFDALLDARVLLQKPMASANRLPPPAALAALADAKPALATALAEVRAEGAALMTDLLRLRAALAGAHPDAIAAGREGKRRRGAEDALPFGKRAKAGGAGDDDAATGGKGAEELWAAAVAGWEATAAFRKRTGDNLGLNLTEAAEAGDAPTRVKGPLADDADRVVKRACPPAAKLALLGVTLPPSSSAGVTGLVTTDGYYLEAYDDSTSFSKYLRQVARGAPGEDGTSAATLASILLKHPSVKRAGVDKRATKGRRLKYVVHPKLVNFMAPAPFVVPPERAYDLDAIVGSLFKSA